MTTTVLNREAIINQESPDAVKQRSFDLCIIGAGVTGAALAAYLGSKGLKIALIEKQWDAPERIVGELLQPDGVRQLQLMGLSDVLDHIDAQRIKGYAISQNKNELRLDYPESEAQYGYGLSNRLLLNTLRKKVLKQSTVSVFEGKAEKIIYRENKVIAVLAKQNESNDLYQLQAPLTISSDGFFSLFRKELHQQKAVVTGYYLGILLHNCPLPHPNFGHVFINEGIKFLAYPTATNSVRLLIEKKDKKLPLKGEKIKAWLNENIRSQLPKDMHAAFDESIAKGDFQMMPSQILPGNADLKPGLLLLGDALNMRNPLTGGGMTAGLNDARILAELILSRDFANESEQMKLMQDFHKQRKNNASINILADALNQVFSDPELSIACFNYLQKGGNYAAEPLGLLAGIKRDQKLLLRHFFAVAFYGAANQINLKGIKGMANAGSMLKRANGILSPLMLNEKQGAFSRYFWKIAQRISN